MSDTAKPDDLEWAAARAVWSKAGVEISDNRSSESEHFLSELKLAVASFREMERITTADRQREWSMEDGAKLCGDLSSFIGSIDDIALPRIVRGGSPNFDPTMTTLMFQLAELEHAFRRAPEAPTVRRHKHEISDPLVIRLADSFKRHSESVSKVMRLGPICGRGA